MMRLRFVLSFSVFLTSFVFSASYPFSNPVFGSTPAPFTLEYFSVHDCQYCDDFEANVLPALTPDVEAGHLRIIFRDLPPESPHVRKLTELVFCSQHDPRYLEFRTQMKRELRSSPGSQPHPSLELDLDTRSTELQQSCLEESLYLSVAVHNKSTFEKFGFQGTPAFVLTRSVGDGYEQMAWSGSTGIRSIMQLLSSDFE